MTIRVGITGQSGFIGCALFAALRLDARMSRVEFTRDLWDDPARLRDWCGRCDVIVHLAGMSRAEDGELLYRTNLELAQKLRSAAGSARLLLGSTTHDAKDLPYHRSKRDQMKYFDVTVRMPNAFGAYGKPFFNSVVSTFCYLAARREPLTVAGDAELELIDLTDLCRGWIGVIAGEGEGAVRTLAPSGRIRVPELAAFLTAAQSALDRGRAPELPTPLHAKLFAALLSYQR